jgi:hypothetical protein
MFFLKFQSPKTQPPKERKKTKEYPPTSLLCKPGITQKNHAFIYDRKYSRNAYHNRSCDAYDSHAMIASSSSFVHSRDFPRKSVIHHMPRRNVVHLPRKMHNENTTIIHACNTDFVLQCKNKKVVARKLGAKCKGDKTCISVPMDIITNLVGPNKSWVPKTQA